MKLISAAVISISLLFPMTAASSSGIDRQALEKKIDATFEASLELHKNKDLEGLVNRFTRDGTIKIPGQPMISGHDALRDHYKRSLQREVLSFDYSIHNLDFSEASDMAVLTVEFHATVATPDGSANSSATILMAKKKVDGAWKIHAESLVPGPAF